MDWAFKGPTAQPARPPGKRRPDCVPDLPGCIATGATVEETEQLLREAIALHIEGLQEDGLPIPEPSSVVEYLELPAGESNKDSRPL
jgi:predicted RNase H-like HicB family nuclease